jgi:hypothetical protein
VFHCRRRKQRKVKIALNASVFNVAVLCCVLLQCTYCCPMPQSYTFLIEASYCVVCFENFSYVSGNIHLMFYTVLVRPTALSSQWEMRTFSYCGFDSFSRYECQFAFLCVALRGVDPMYKDLRNAELRLWGWVTATCCQLQASEPPNQ